MSKISCQEVGKEKEKIHGSTEGGRAESYCNTRMLGIGLDRGKSFDKAPPKGSSQNRQKAFRKKGSLFFLN